MKKIHLFRAGTHTSSSGSEMTFSEGDLIRAVESYDPDLHEAPITVGHPKDNSPAFGWVEKMDFSNGEVSAFPRQVNPEFAELVKAGTYKKISASWYLPDAPTNPRPGGYYLRHVGFLGGQPPAVKGLGGVEFEDSGDGVVFFEEPVEFDEMETASLWRRLREFLIAKFGVEDADTVVPDYIVQDLEDEARNPRSQTDPQFSEGEMSSAEDRKKLEDLSIENESLKSANGDLSNEVEKLRAQVREFSAVAEKAEIEQFCAEMIKQGRLLPSEKDPQIELLLMQDNKTEIDFSEGEKKTARARMMDVMRSRPKILEFAEKTQDDETDDPGTLSAPQIAALATEYMDEQSKKGIKVTTSEAVAHVVADRAA